MNMAAKVVKSYWDSKGVKSEFRGDDNEAISVKYSGENMDTISLVFIFGSDNADVSIKAYSICSFNDEQKNKMYEVCSKLNARFRWAKFYVDEDDKDITAETDAVIQLDSCGEECFELLIRMVSIIDDAYSEIMKARWA